MNKRLIIIIVVLALIGGGIAVATRGNDKNKSADNSSKASSQTSSSQPAANSNSFAPVSTEGQPFVATISSDGTTQGTIQSDGKGNTSYESTQNGTTTRIVYTSDAYYICTGSTCYKYVLGASSPVSFNPSDYQYTKDKLTGYKSGATYKGKQSCPAGTCDVWSVSNAGVTSSLFIDSKSKLISQVESSLNGKTTKITYEFKAVTIDVPTNAQTLPTQ